LKLGLKIRMNGAIEKYNARVKNVHSLLCAGLDPNTTGSQFEFNKRIIEDTAEYVAAYKPNIAFYEAHGDRGMRDLKTTLEYLQGNHPDVLTICDAKRADIGSTSQQYAKAIFEWFGFDAVTLNPYLGQDSLQPFLDYKDKGCIILCRTSNPDAKEFQDLLIEGKPLWQRVAERVAEKWNKNENCMLVAGATYPEELKTIRGIVDDMTLLVPGIGAQGGDIKSAVQAGLNSRGQGLIMSTGRAILLAENPADAARTLRDEINSYRE
jgi:orotidine-5'-phosphate decarboxylase